MDPLTDQLDESLTETPEDVAVLYSWANLHGAKYRDFSASRREYRAQVRHRAAEELRQTELQAKAEAEAAAAEAERVAGEAARAARSADNFTGIDRDRAMQDAEAAARRAAAERVEAARRAESAAIAEAVARREEREIAEAHASAERQAARYVESESRRRMAAGPQPRPAGLQSDPFEFAQGSQVNTELYTPDLAIDYTQAGIRPREDYASRVSGERRTFRPVEPEYRRRPQGFRPDEASGIRPAFRPQVAPAPRGRLNPADDGYPQVVSPEAENYSGEPSGNVRPAGESLDPRDRSQGSGYSQEIAALDRRAQELGQQERARQNDRSDASLRLPQESFSQSGVFGQEYPFRQQESSRSQDRSIRQPEQDSSARANVTQAPRSGSQKGGNSGLDYSEQGTPAWLYGSEASVRSVPGSGVAASRSRTETSVTDTLQHSRERVASRWFALKGVFEPGQDIAQESAAVNRNAVRTPVAAIFSLAGGVGKTSIVATLGRALSSLGEKVLLADTTSHGLLPYYFGASELRPGVTRTFSPPSGSTDAPIHLVSFDVAQAQPEVSEQNAFAGQLAQSASGTSRILLDLNAGSGWIIKRLPGMLPAVLVPVAPDMNSVISLQAVEKYFQGIFDSDGKPVKPYYVLNQFDASLPLHLDVREVLRRQLGDRLLSVVIRRAPAVSEALAEGMTVVDYAPESGVAEDYMNLAHWLRGMAAPAGQGFRNIRWSER